MGLWETTVRFNRTAISILEELANNKHINDPVTTIVTTIDTIFPFNPCFRGILLIFFPRQCFHTNLVAI